MVGPSPKSDRESQNSLKQGKSISGLHGGQICLAVLWLMGWRGKSRATRPARRLQQASDNELGHGNTDIPSSSAKSYLLTRESYLPPTGTLVTKKVVVATMSFLFYSRLTG